MTYRRPPGPTGGRLVGNLLAYEEDRLGFLMAAKRDYGPIVSFDRYTTMLLGAEPARCALLDRDHAFAVPINFLQQELSARGLQAAVHTRTVTNAAYRRMPTDVVAAAAAAELRRQVGQLPRGLAIDPLPMLEAVMSQTTTRYFFGDDGGELPILAGHLLDALGTVVGNPFAMAGQSFTPARRRISRRHRELRLVVDPLIEARRRQPTRYDDLVSAALKSAGRDVSDDQLSRWVVAGLLAGHRVPAAAASWMLYCLSHQPDLQWQSLLNSVEPIAQSPTLIPGRRFVNLASAVVLETLRLYPPTWMTERVAARPVRIGGFDFPTGHHFLVSPYVLHRDDTAWDGAVSFDPGRWMQPTQPRGTFMPFGVGLRSCPGRELASAVLNAIVNDLVPAFSVQDRSLQPVIPDPRTTLLPRGLLLTFERRRLSGQQGGISAASTA